MIIEGLDIVVDMPARPGRPCCVLERVPYGTLPDLHRLLNLATPGHAGTNACALLQAVVPPLQDVDCVQLDRIGEHAIDPPLRIIRADCPAGSGRWRIPIA